jgi:hypothetical protein
MKPRARVLTARSVGRTLKYGQFRLRANDRGTTEDRGEHPANPVRKRCGVVHRILPEGRHLGLWAEDTVEELAHDNEEGHEGSGDH